MNNYPSWWDTTITIYNKYEDPTTRVVTWYKNTVQNCFWKYSDSKLIIDNTVIEANDIICRIPKSDTFTEYYLWVDLSAEQKAAKFTLHVGDIIVKGTATDTIDEYTAGSRSSDLLNKYKKLQGCMVVDYAILNVDGGRGQEHYRVKGS